MPKPKKAGAAVGDIVRHAAAVQQKVDKAREALRNEEVSADFAGGKVRVTVTCAGQLRRIHVEPTFLDVEGLEMTLDLIVATTNKALEDADRMVEEAMTEAAGGLRIPGVNA